MALFNWLCSLLLAGLYAPCSFAAEGFRINGAQVSMIDGVYHVDAQIDYGLSSEARDALENGVPLTLEVDLKLLLQRQYLWDETIATLVQRYRLSYRALSRLYQVENLNNDDVEGFQSLSAALAYLRQLRQLPVIDRSLLDPQRKYLLSLGASLDIESLPTPLRAMAYVTPGWYLSSPNYTTTLAEPAPPPASPEDGQTPE